jgi:homoserine kinase type II
MVLMRRLVPHSHENRVHTELAVYTTITDRDVSAHLLDYDIGELESLKGIAEGVQNSNYFLSTSKGQYILTLYEQMVEETDLPFYIGLMEHLHDNGINCPQPMKMKNGKALSTLCGRPAAIVSFLKGVSVSQPLVQQCNQLGIMLAKMHLATKHFSMHLDNALNQSNWRAFYQRSNGRDKEIDENLPAAMRAELNFLDDNWPVNLPSGVIHADLFPDNVFFLGETLSGFIDFYFAADDLLAFDLAICINAWCFDNDGSFNLRKSRALLKGYQSVRALEKEECDALPVLCRGASIRFLVTRIYDWLNVPEGALVTPHDPIIYLNRLQFHQTINNAEQYGLESQFLKKASGMSSE